MVARTASLPPGSPASGTVVEVIPVESYTYIRLEEQGRWFAVPPLEVSEGDRVLPEAPKEEKPSEEKKPPKKEKKSVKKDEDAAKKKEKDSPKKDEDATEEKA